MNQIKQVIRQMIDISEKEMEGFLKNTFHRNFKKKEFLSQADKVADEIFFINQGMLRVLIIDFSGVEHTVHFALENQFIADYSSFLQKTPAAYRLQALEDLETVVLPRSAIDWGYEHIREGEKLGRQIAEFYFIYLDNRIKYLYSKSPKERYDMINHIFPSIQQRVPQHMIASYLGITSVHLSRLKKNDR